MEHMGPIGELIRKKREALGLSQGDVARLSGLTQGAISHIEVGMYRPSMQTLAILVRTLSISPEELVRALFRELEENYQNKKRGPRKTPGPA